MNKPRPIQDVFYFIMKITLAQLLLMVILTSLVSAGPLKGQGILERKVSLKAENMEIKSILSEIEKQTSVVFTYRPRLIRATKKISFKVRDEKLADVLKQLFSPEISYVAMDDEEEIVLKPSDDVNPIKVASPLAQTPTIQVSGKVTEKSGLGLPGVNVVEKGTTNGTTTDAEGRYSLSVEDENSVLVFSFIGYKSQEMVVNGKSAIEVVLVEDVQSLGEVVIVGYGTQKAEDLTGAISTVNVKSLGNRPVTDVAALLQGVAPGLNIRPSSDVGGEPGAAMNIDIRGTGSLSGGGPFILVDGVPMDINRISPNEIETVTVLKDAAASAIYGARAPYGVILITTKKGEKNKKAELTYSAHFGFRSPTTLPRLANSLDFADGINYAAQNSGSNRIFSDEMIQHMINFQANPDTYPGSQVIPGLNQYASGGPYTNANTDWYDVIFKDRAFQQNHNIGLSGGTQNTAYYLGIDITQQEGSMNFANDKYARYNLTSNLSVDPTSWITMSLRTKVIHADNKYPIGQQTTASKGQFFVDLPRLRPTSPVYTPDGHIAQAFVNLLANGGSDVRFEDRLILTPEIEVRISKDWNVTANFNYHVTNTKSKFVANKMYDYKVDGTPVLNSLRTYDLISRDMSNNQYMSSNVFSTYSKEIGAHNVKLMVGGQAEESKLEGLNGSKRDLITPQVESISSATGSYNVSDMASHWATLGVFGRFNYNYKEKYLLELNGRYDGSSRFGEGKRWGFFPSASAGYAISKEHFWQPLSHIIDNLKLRGSYGSLGNQNVANYLHHIIIPINTNLDYIIDGVRPIYAGAPGLGSVGLTWETSSTVNFGVDAGFLEDKLTLTADIYDRKTTDMFGPGESLPNLLGTAIPKQNNATLQTKGIELTVGWNHQINDLGYHLTLIYSDNRSTVLKYNNPTKILNNYYEGMALGELWGFESEGLFQSKAEVTEGAADQSQLYGNWQEGDMRYRDLDGDGKITYGDNTLGDPGDRRIIGNSSPRHMFGFQASATYKGFDLGFLFQGVAKREDFIDDNVFFGFSPLGTGHTSLRDYNLDYWTPENTDAYYARPYVTSENSKNQVPQTRFLQNASYLRLKNVQIGYSAPRAFLDMIGIQRARIFMSGEDLLTFTGLPHGVDPENSYGSEKDYPLTKVMSAGLEITF